ncbi:hypothetical protein AB0J40_38465 [Amycolatopsis sp. NPDC049691]
MSSKILFRRAMAVLCAAGLFVLATAGLVLWLVNTHEVAELIEVIVAALR